MLPLPSETSFQCIYIHISLVFKVYKITFYLHLIASSQGGCVIYIDTHDLHAVGYPSGRHAGLPPRSQGADPGLHMLNHLISIDSFIMVINSFGRASNLEVSNRQKKIVMVMVKNFLRRIFLHFHFVAPLNIQFSLHF